VADALNAFVPGVEVRVAGRAGGPLADLTFAAKDLFDVAGHPTGGGNPDWGRQHPLPARHAWAVQMLLDAGATLIGKTITDEVSLGILGENPFYGTPLNTRAPGRVAGGSSSGSVRVPASFCGLYGIRPTHGRLPVTGMLPQAPRSDTTGWFARDAGTFARVSGVMLGEAIAPARPKVLIVAVDAFGLADPEVIVALQPMVKALSGLAGETREDLLAPQGISVWARAQRTLQPWEAWLTFREWVDRDNPRMAFGVARGLIAASMIPESERGWAELMRREARARMAHLLTPGTVLCLPTTPFPAPHTGQAQSALQPVRDRILCLCAHGGLTGVPQVSLPGSTVDGLPVGLSIVAAPGADALLVGIALALTGAA
jgi:amidase